MLMFAVVATLLPSLTTVWISYIENKRALSAKASEELLGLSAQAAREVDLWTKELRYNLRVFSSSERPRRVALPVDWATELTKHDWALGPPYWDSTAAHAEMLVSVPIESARRAGRGAGGTHLLGALSSRVNLHGLADTLLRFRPGESGQIYLMTRTGRLVVSSRGSSQALMREGFSRNAANSLLAREGRAVQFTSFTGERVVGSLRTVPAMNWLLMSEIPSTEAFRQVARLRNVTLGVVTLLLAVVGALAYLLSLLIVRPLDRLAQAAGTVAKGDLEVGLPVTTGGEVGYLTEVFNNMVERVRENEVRRSRRLHHQFAVVMADVDLFKRYNDEYGHPAGDGVLKRVAAIMREASRDVDFVARYGGEEFLIMMPETEIDGATEFAERIRKKIGSERLPNGEIRISLGVSAFPMHGDAPDQLIAEADAALYLAKRAGGDRVVAAAPASIPAASKNS